MTYQDFVKSVASKAYESGMFELVDALTTVVFDDRISTMATNGHNIFVNPKFAETLTSDEVIGVLAHEMLHDEFGHDKVPWRVWDRNSGLSEGQWHHLCNVAMDIVVNDAVDSLGLTLPKGALRREDFDIPASMDYSEAIFRKLLGDVQQQNEMMQKIAEAMQQMMKEEQDNQSVASRSKQRASSNGYPKGSPQAAKQQQQQAQSNGQDDEDGQGAQAQQGQQGQQQQGSMRQSAGSSGQQGEDSEAGSQNGQSSSGDGAGSDLQKEQEELDKQKAEHQKKVDDLNKRMQESGSSQGNGADGDDIDEEDEGSGAGKSKEELEKEKEELEKEAKDIEEKQKNLDERKKQSEVTDEQKGQGQGADRTGDTAEKSDGTEAGNQGSEQEQEEEDDFWDSPLGQKILSGEDPDDEDDEEGDDEEEGDADLDDEGEGADGENDGSGGSGSSSDDGENSSDSESGQNGGGGSAEGRNKGHAGSEKDLEEREKRSKPLGEIAKSLAGKVQQNIKEHMFSRQPVTSSTMMNTPPRKEFWVDRVFEHIGRFVQAVKRDRTFARPGRRPSMSLPGSAYKTPAAGQRRIEPEPRVIFFIDVSGSMDYKPEDIRKSLLLRAHILNRTRSVIVPFSDKVSSKEYSLEESFVHCDEWWGGTNFWNVVKAINSYQGQYDLFVIVTDMGGSVDFSEVERNKHLIVVTDSPQSVRGLPDNAELIGVDEF